MGLEGQCRGNPLHERACMAVLINWQFGKTVLPVKIEGYVSWLHVDSRHLLARPSEESAPNAHVLHAKTRFHQHLPGFGDVQTGGQVPPDHLTTVRIDMRDGVVRHFP